MEINDSMKFKASRWSMAMTFGLGLMSSCMKSIPYKILSIKGPIILLLCCLLRSSKVRKCCIWSQLLYSWSSKIQLISESTNRNPERNWTKPAKDSDRSCIQLRAVSLWSLISITDVNWVSQHAWLRGGSCQNVLAVVWKMSEQPDGRWVRSRLAQLQR